MSYDQKLALAAFTIANVCISLGVTLFTISIYLNLHDRKNRKTPKTSGHVGSRPRSHRYVPGGANPYSKAIAHTRVPVAVTAIMPRVEVDDANNRLVVHGQVVSVSARR